MYTANQLKMNKEEEKSFILKTAKMRLEKVEQRLKTLRSKQALKQCGLQEKNETDKSTEISRKISVVVTAVDDLKCGGDGLHLVKLEREAGKFSHSHLEEVIPNSEDASMSAIHKARHVLNKFATYDKSSQLYSVFKSLPHSAVSKKNLSSGVVHSGMKNESDEDSSQNFHDDLHRTDRASHFSKMLYMQEAEVTDVDRWRTKKLNNELEKLFSNSTSQLSDENSEAAEDSDNDLKENIIPSLENMCWHLDCLSVETQWDSQFIDSMQVKRCHLEAVKDWRRQRPLDKLMSGGLRDLPVDITSLPHVVDDIIVCEVLRELQRGLSCQIGEDSELTKDLVEDFFQQLSCDLDLLTDSICSYTAPSKLNKREPEVLSDSQHVECSSSASNLISNLEQQLGTIMNATSLQQSLTVSSPKDFGLLSLSRTFKCHQKVDEESDQLSEKDLKNLYSPFDLMPPKTAESVEKFPSSNVKDVRNYSKRSYGHDLDCPIESRKKKTDVGMNEFKISDSNEEFEEDYGFTEEKCRRNDRRSRNRKKRKSSRRTRERNANNISIDVNTTHTSACRAPLDLENCDLFDAKENGSVQDDGEFEQYQQSDVPQKSPDFSSDEQHDDAVKSFEDGLTGMDNKLLSMVDGAIMHFKGDVKSMIVDKMGSVCVGLLEASQTGVNLSEISLCNLHTLSQIPLRILHSHLQGNCNSRRQFKSFDKLCVSEIAGGNRIIESVYNAFRARNRENRDYRKRRSYVGLRAPDAESERHRQMPSKRYEDTIVRDTNQLPSSEAISATTCANYATTVEQEHTQLSPKVVPLASLPTRQTEVSSAVTSVISAPPKRKPISERKTISAEKSSKVTVQSCPRFMQTFRQSQIAKRKNQSSVLSSSVLWPSEFPFPSTTVSENSAKNGSLVQNGDVATVLNDEVSLTMSDMLYSIPLPTLPAAFSTTCTTPVEYKVESVRERQSALTAFSSKTIDMFSSGDGFPIPASTATSSSLVVSTESPHVNQTVTMLGSASTNTPTIAVVPFPDVKTVIDGVGKPENCSAIVNCEECPLRIFIFNQERKECQLAKAGLMCRGAMTFDPYNVVLLRAIFPLECLVLVHSSDLARLYRVSNLMRLKRDLRISFVAYDTVDDALSRNFKPVYPRGGFVVIDTGTLIHCNSDHLEKVCQFMQKQANEKGIAWQLMISPEVANILNAHKCEVQRTDQQLAKLADVIARYCSSGIIDIISTELFKRSRMSAFDYQQCCLALQVQNMHKYRHFLFITDAVKQHVNVKGFTENGVDVMSISEFLRGFIGCSVTAPSKLCKEYTSAISTEAFAKYIDSVPSSGSETLMNKWIVPSSVTNEK